MIKESLAPKLALNRSEQVILYDTLIKTVSEVVEASLADHDTTQHYESGTRFPFLSEKDCESGSFGKVTMFELPDEYLDENRPCQNDDDARTNADDILRSYTDLPRPSCTLSDLEVDSVHLSVTAGGAASTSTATSAEEESRPKSFDYGTCKDEDGFPTSPPKPPAGYGDLHLSNFRTLAAAE